VFILYRRETTKLTTTFTMQKEVVLALKIRVDQTSCNDVYWTVLLHDQSCTCIYVMYCKNKLLIYIYIYRVSQEECEILRESVPYVKLYRYNPKHLYPKLNGYGDNAQRSLKL